MTDLGSGHLGRSAWQYGDPELPHCQGSGRHLDNIGILTSADLGSAQTAGVGSLRTTLVVRYCQGLPSRRTEVRHAV